MLLTIDIGNTNITMGVFEEEKLLGMFRMTTKRQRTSDEYGFTICGILEHRGIDPEKIDAVIIASVVPDIMHSFTSGIIKYLDTAPVIVSAETDTGVKVLSDNPSRTGPDRIVNAAAGYAIAQGPAIVIDFGTATTYDLVGPGNTLEACIIAPGIETAGRSLWGRCGHAPRDPDQETGLDPGEGYGHRHAGRTCVRSGWADRIYRKTDERRVGLYRRLCHCDRRSGEDHRE